MQFPGAMATASPSRTTAQHNKLSSRTWASVVLDVNGGFVGAHHEESSTSCKYPTCSSVHKCTSVVLLLLLFASFSDKGHCEAGLGNGHRFICSLYFRMVLFTVLALRPLTKDQLSSYWYGVLETRNWCFGLCIHCFVFQTQCSCVGSWFHFPNNEVILGLALSYSGPCNVRMQECSLKLEYCSSLRGVQLDDFRESAKGWSLRFSESLTL